MRKQFVFNLAFLVFANLLVKPLWIFGIDRVVQNKLGAAEYGTYFALFNYSLLFSVLLDLGLNNFNNRSISRTPSRINSYFGNLLTIKVLLSALYFIVTLAFAVLSGFNALQIKLLLLLLANQALLTLVLFFRSNLQALQLFKTDGFISVTDKLFATVICFVLLFRVGDGTFTIWHFALAQTAGLLVAVIISGLLVATKAQGKFSFWTKRFTLKVLKATLPYALLVLLMTVYGRIDAVMLERLLPDAGAIQAGIYAASFRIFDAANQFGFLFSTILLPLFAANFKQKADNQSLFEFGLKTIALFAVGVAVVCYGWAADIMQLLYHTNSNEWVGVFKITMLCFIPASLTYIAGTMLTAKGELIALCKISAMGMVFNIVANLLLIDNYGALGAAIAALATNTLMFILHLWAIKSRNAIHLNFGVLWRIAGFSAVLFAIVVLKGNLTASIPLQLAICSLVGVVAMFAFGMFSFKELLQLLNNKLQRTSV